MNAPAAVASDETRLFRLLSGLALAVLAADACFWGASAAGASVGAFVLVLTGAILVNRPRLVWDRHLAVVLMLLAGALLATVLETSFVNGVVLWLLITVLAGETFFTGVVSRWGRWLSISVALVRAPGRPFWLIGLVLRAALSGGWLGRVLLGAVLALPALALALIFGALLASGNAVFGAWTSHFFDWFWHEVGLLLNIYRLTFWSFVAVLALPLLRPVDVSSGWWSWTQKLPPLPDFLPTRAAVISSIFILVLLNVLFLAANIADLIFLWGGQALPKGVSYSGFVHQGVDSLIVTVLLSALVLTTLFQQTQPVSRHLALRWLGLWWIGQNLFLLLSVGLRLKLYIEAYDMTVERLSLMIFLALVVAGYGLLTVKIIHDKSLSWLLGGCVLAVFAVLYVTQFLDLAGWSANYNVARWEKDRTRHLDLDYLYSLRADAWPALMRVQSMDPNAGAWQKTEARNVRHWDIDALTRFDARHWREFSLRAWLNRQALGEMPNN